MARKKSGMIIKKVYFTDRQLCILQSRADLDGITLSEQIRRVLDLYCNNIDKQNVKDGKYE
jgi:hypothetical protein